MADEYDLWALWPDDTMSPLAELENYLHWMSDDYLVVKVLEYYEDGSPSKWSAK